MVPDKPVRKKGVRDIMSDPTPYAYYPEENQNPTEPRIAPGRITTHLHTLIRPIPILIAHHILQHNRIQCTRSHHPTISQPPNKCMLRRSRFTCPMAAIEPHRAMALA